MSPRERLTAAARGGEVDRKPVISRTPNPQADAVVLEMDRVGDRGEQVQLVSVELPLARAMREGLALSKILHDTPSEGEEILKRLEAECRAEMTQALETGADGVCAEMKGAEPGESSPMEYGGHYLEVDRRLLHEIAPARFNVLYVHGAEPYLDFVSDLPAHALAWDMQASDADMAEIRDMKAGPVAGNRPEADIYFVNDFEEAKDWIGHAEAVN